MRSSFPTLFPLFAIFIIIILRRPAHMLKRRGAISAETAQRLDDIKPSDRRRLDNLVARGIIREASPGQYYFDLEAERAQSRMLRPWLVGAVVVLGLVALGLWYFRQPHVRPLP